MVLGQGVDAGRWCELRNDFRMFRLDRIAKMADSGESFGAERGKSLTDFYRTMGERSRDTEE